MTVLSPPALDRADEAADHSGDPDTSIEPGGERAGIYLAALIALAVPSIIVLAFFLPSNGNTATPADPRTSTPAAGLDSTDVPAEAVSAEVAGAVETTTGAATEIPAETTEPAADTAEEAQPVDLSSVDPESIDVFIYDETPAADGEYTFALRLKSTTTAQELDTSLFSVRMQDSEGATAAATVRFVHDTLPVGSSALATARATDTGSATNFVVVSLGDVEIGRVLYDIG